MPDDRLAVAVAELYAAAPEDFTPRRGELVAAAREAGDRAAAQAIGALRRPTRAAWVVNTLARADPGAAPRLDELAAGLRQAQQAGDGRRLRELSVERDGVIDTFTAQALDAAGVTDAPPSLRLEVSQTLTAALADPGVGAEFAAGTLTRAMQWSGFGVAPAGEGGEAEAGAEKAQVRLATAAAPRGASADRPIRGAAGAAPPRPRESPAPALSAPSKAKSAKATRAEPDAAARRQAEQAEHRRANQAARRAEEAERRAREAAEQAAARRREQYEEAERAVASAAAAATEAAAAEDRLEAEVRDLEERLVKARADLEATRLRARRAEGAERRARQALGRLPHS